MMIGRLLNAEEQQCLNRERLEAEQRKNDEEMHAQQSSIIDNGFRVECDKKRIRLDIEKMETNEDDQDGDDRNCIDEQVQSAIDSILNLQQKPSDTYNSTPVQCNDDDDDSKPEPGTLLRQQQQQHYNNNNNNSFRKKVVSMHIDSKAMDEAVRSILS